MITAVPLFTFLIAGTVTDIKKRTIPVILLVLSGATGILISLTTGEAASGALTDWFFGLLLGVVFIGISLISDGKLGMGDALAILVTGIFLGGKDAALAVLNAMMATSFVSIIILAVKKVSRKTELPFMPFLLFGCILQQTGAFI